MKKLIELIKAKVKAIAEKVKAYFKAATVKSVVKDVIKAVVKFFDWKFSRNTVSILASLIVYYECYKVLGFILLAASVVMLISDIVSYLKSKKKAEANTPTAATVV